MIFIRTVIICFLSTIFISKGEVFTAISDVEALIHYEKDVSVILRDLVAAERKKISVIEEYIDSFDKLYSNKQQEQIVNFVGHPVNAFSLVKRLGVEWNGISNLIKTNLGLVGLQQIERRRETVKLPDSNEDMKGAAEAIVRLQHTYKLDEKMVASGTIPGVKTTAPALSSLDCYLLGYHQAQMGFHDYAIEWLQLAAHKYDEEIREGIEPKIRKEEILDWLQHSHFHFGNVSRALSITETIKDIAPEFPNIDRNAEYYKKVIEEMPEDIKRSMMLGPKREKHTGGNYEALCRGELEVPRKIRKDLKCYLETYNNPKLLLQPVKTEIVFKNPDIFMLHDVATESQMERVKKVARHHLHRAQVVKPGTDQFEATRIRISKSAFLRDEFDPIVVEMNKRIGDVTNLNMNMAEDLQVANYGIGGHYDPHFDHFRTVEQINKHQVDQKMGDRIATFLLYMTDVEAGGATVFPRINLTVYPQKGSAAFWYNLHKDGLGDENTLHAACPVLCGTKWISNKWIREKWQDVTRPCGPERDSSEWEDGWPEGF